MLDMPYYGKKTFPTVFPTCVIASMLHCTKHHISYSGADVGHAILWEEDLFTVFPTCVIAIVCYTVQNITYPTVGQMLDMPYYGKKTFPTVFPTCVIAIVCYTVQNITYPTVGQMLDTPYYTSVWEEDLSYSISHTAKFE